MQRTNKRGQVAAWKLATIIETIINVIEYLFLFVSINCSKQKISIIKQTKETICERAVKQDFTTYIDIKVTKKDITGEWFLLHKNRNNVKDVNIVNKTVVIYIPVNPKEL